MPKLSELFSPHNPDEVLKSIVRSLKRAKSDKPKALTLYKELLAAVYTEYEVQKKLDIEEIRRLHQSTEQALTDKDLHWLASAFLESLGYYRNHAVVDTSLYFLVNDLENKGFTIHTLAQVIVSIYALDYVDTLNAERSQREQLTGAPLHERFGDFFGRVRSSLKKLFF